MERLKKRGPRAPLREGPPYKEGKWTCELLFPGFADHAEGPLAALDLDGALGGGAVLVALDLFQGHERASYPR